jgi:hypothetical protein
MSRSTSPSPAAEGSTVAVSGSTSSSVSNALPSRSSANSRTGPDLGQRPDQGGLVHLYRRTAQPVGQLAADQA